MHEMKYVVEILKNMETVKQEHHFKQIKKVNLLIGELSGIDPQALCNAFLMATANSAFNKVKIVCQIEKLKVKCKNCGEISQIFNFDFMCGYCLSREVTETGGRGIFIESFEGEV